MQQMRICIKQQSQRWCVLRAYAKAATAAASSHDTQQQQQQPTAQDWCKIVHDAERIVGYPTSFLSLRWLLSDEIANVAMQLRKLVGSHHPLLKTAKRLLYSSKESTPAWGLIVLLISKTAGHEALLPAVDLDKSAGVLHSQRALAELTEMIRMAACVHKSLVNLQLSAVTNMQQPIKHDLAMGNKIGLLAGDYLLVSASATLAGLRNQEVTGLISSTVRDFAESEFIGRRDLQNNALPSKPRLPDNMRQLQLDFDEFNCFASIPIGQVLGIAEADWECRSMLNSCSLLAKSCKSAMKLAAQSLEVQQRAYKFGKHLALSWQASLDAAPYLQPTLPIGHKLSLVSAPMLFQLQHEPAFYQQFENSLTALQHLDYAQIHQKVRSGPALAQTKALQQRHSNAALQMLQHFPVNDAHTALLDIINSTKESLVIL